MNSLIHHRIEPKIAFLGRKFVSSVALIDQHPPIFQDQNLITLNPFHFFNKWMKSKKFTISDTKIIHAHFLKTNHLSTDIFVANSLVDCYLKSSAIDYALKLFDMIPSPNTVSWNVMISGHNHNFMFEDSWRIFCLMHFSGFDPDQFTYGSVLSACSALLSSFSGMLVYGLTLKNGLFSNGYIRAGMIELLAKCGEFEDALKLFYDVSCEKVVCWNALISGAVKNKQNWVALDLFSQMCRGSLLPNTFTFSSILTACTAVVEIELGRGVHGLVIKRGAEDVFVGTAIVDLYAKCGDMEEALKKFLHMPNQNVVSWTAIISGFVQKGDYISALQFFREMIKQRKEINNYTVTSVLAACTDTYMIEEAMQVHCWSFKTALFLDVAVTVSLINFYSKMGQVDLCETLFREATNFKHQGTWAVMISAFAQNNSYGRAINLFQRIAREGWRPDKFCSSSVLSIVDSIVLGRQIHCYTLKAGLVFDASVGCSLLTMYSKCGNLEESYKVFDQLSEKDNVSWASMISGFAEHGFPYQAIQLFRDMLFEEAMPDEMTFTAVLTACTALHSLKTGKEVHGYTLRRGHSVHILGAALVNMYSKSGALCLGRTVFDMIAPRDTVACSSLVSGYAQNGNIEDALQMFQEMLMANLEMDSFTISSVLGIVVHLNRSSIGTQLHSFIIKVGLGSHASVGGTLVMMYSKCGSIDDCRKAFNQILKPDLISWTAMIASYAQHGKGAEALGVYEFMRKSGTKPDSVTFVGILSACSHNGLVEEGYYYLNSMIRDHGIEPGYHHYACMVDLLGRSGRLQEAEKFIKSMPIKPDALVWGTLLAACKLHGDLELGRLAAKKVLELEPDDAGASVSLSNISADLGHWEEVLKIRGGMKGTGMKKEPGWSYA